MNPHPDLPDESSNFLPKKSTKLPKLTLSFTTLPFIPLRSCSVTTHKIYTIKNLVLFSMLLASELRTLQRQCWKGGGVVP